MEKGKASSLFINDGSFMERFKQLQQDKEKGAKVDQSKSVTSLSGSQKPKPVFTTSTSASDSKVSDSRKTNKTSSAGKLAFSLKPKSKLVAPAFKLSEDDEEDENNASGDEPIKRQKLDQNYVSHHDDVC
nr:SURP and G-patch domain-containing protein 1-like protein isoform X1 [Tanacetum cinerariifolium]